MRDRRSQYDVTNQVNVSEVPDVLESVIEVFADVYPKFNRSVLKKAFEDCHKLFEGEHPDYLPCDTLYHDKQHTMDMTLALARLINGHERTASKSDRIGAQRALIGVITALYHDSGYLRKTHDHHHHNGAEYTLTHVSRSAEYLKRYFHKIELGEHSQISGNMVHYTGLEVAPSHIRLPDEKTHLVGHMLGTADLIAQMSDRCYLEKCRDRLYPEFVLGGIAVQVDEHGKEHVIYESAEDLLRKTPAFYEREIENRLNKLFNQVYNYEQAHFDGERNYIHALGQNQAYLNKVLKEDDFSLLRRRPPENYGTRNFPGLDEYLNQHPQKKAVRQTR
jgi:hypothetical protein